MTHRDTVRIARIPRAGIATVAVLTALVPVAAAPAFAGDVPQPVASTAAPLQPDASSIVGSWVTRTDGVKQTAIFHKNGNVSGNSGCNQYMGKYTVDGDELHIGPLASTMMACAPRVMDAEATFLTRMGAAVGYNVKGRTLMVFAPKDVVRFRSAK